MTFPRNALSFVSGGLRMHRVLRFAFLQCGPSTGLPVRYIALQSPIVLLNRSERRRFCSN